MRKVIVCCVAALILNSCQKESVTMTTQETITGKWISTFTSDAVKVTSTNKLLTEINYATGQGTVLTFNGKAAVASYDPVFDHTFNTPYTVTVSNGSRYITASLFGLPEAAYEVLFLNANTLELKGITATNITYTYLDVNDYNVYYERTALYTKQ